MNEREPDRLDRIEATLELLSQKMTQQSQQLDNQVALNADLRLRDAELRERTEALTDAVNSLFDSITIIANSVTSVSNSLRNTNSSVRTLANVVASQQQSIEANQAEHGDFRQTILSLQTENRSILGYLEGLSNQ